ncbi:MAG: hypothetical protein M1821_000998 [Bathelium mastoideum]|nr:MAG: hypothetical protein M1821_000998 [Bathelium mastoideum]
MSDAVWDESHVSPLDGLDDLEHFCAADTASTGVGPANSYDWDWLGFSITHPTYFSPDSSAGEMSTSNENTYPESLSASVSTSVTLDQDRPHLLETSSLSDHSKEMDHFLHMQSLNGSSNDLSDTSWEFPVSEAHQKSETDVRPSLPPPDMTNFPHHPTLSAFDHFSVSRPVELGAYQSAGPPFGAPIADFGLGISEAFHGIPAAGPTLQAPLVQPSIHSVYSSGLGPRGLAVPHNSPNHFHHFDDLHLHPQGQSPFASNRALSERIEDLASSHNAYLDPANAETAHQHQRLSAPPQLAFEDEPHHFTPPLRPSSSDQNPFPTSVVDHPTAIYQTSPFPHRPLSRFDSHPTPPVIPSMEDEGQFPFDQSSRFLDAENTRGLSTASHQSARSDSANSGKASGSSATQVKRRRREDSSKAGGRKRGSHLADGTKASAREMRDVVSCWRCVFQRDKCGPGEICHRCLKRINRARVNGGLGCDRTRLMDLHLQFLPGLMGLIHERQALRSFCETQIRHLSDIPITIKLSIGLGPPIVCTVHEFTPTTPELAQQAQYIKNKETGHSERIIKRSPPLALYHVQDADARIHERYIDEFVRRYLANLPRKFYQEEDNDFPERLLKLMVELFYDHPDSKHHPLLGQIMRLILVTYMIGRTLTFTTETQESLLDWLGHRYHFPLPHDPFTSPRMANRQLKYLFSLLHRELLTNLLNKLQQILHSSNVRGNWVPAFLCLLGLAMAQEDIQRTIYIIMDDRWQRREIVGAQAANEADRAAEAIDERFHFLCSLFHSKFNKSLNPLKDTGYEHLSKWIGEREMRFVRDVADLVDEKQTYLDERQQIPISLETQMLSTSRMLARFLVGLKSAQ